MPSADLTHLSPVGYLAHDGNATVVTLDWSSILENSVLAVTLVLGLAGIGGMLYRRLNKVIEHAVSAAVAAQETQRSLKTTNGHTVGQYVEMSAHDLEEIKHQMRNGTIIAQQALRLGIQNREELQEHRAIGHVSSLARRRDGDGQ